MANMGEAIALGIAQGLGTGFQQHQAERREERRDNRKFAQEFDMFTKQRDYMNQQAKVQAEVDGERKQRQARYELGVSKINAIRKQNEDWRTQASKPLMTLKDEYLTKMSQGIGAKNMIAFRNDTAKNVDGWDKARFLDALGYTLSDYTEFEGDPVFTDAIPKQRIANMDIDVSSIFKYAPSQAFTEQQEATKTAVSESEKRALELKGAVNIVKSQVSLMTAAVHEYQGYTMDDDVAESLINVAGGVNKVGQTVQRDGKTLYPVQETFKQLLDAGIIVPSKDAQGAPAFRYKSDVDADTYKAQQAQESPKIVQMEPTVISDEAKRDKVNKVVREYGGVVAENADFIGVGNKAADLAERLESFDEKETRHITGLLASTPISELLANLGDVESIAARKWLQDYANVRNIVLKERSGAAVTDPEFARFKTELEDPGFLTTPETMSAGLRNMHEIMTTTMNRHTSPYRDTEGEKEYLRRNPQVARELGMVAPETPFGEAPSGVTQMQWDEANRIIDKYGLTPEQKEAELKAAFPNYGTSVEDQGVTSAQQAQAETQTTEEQKETLEEAKVAPELPADVLGGLDVLDKADRSFLMSEFNAGRATAEDVRAYLQFLAQQQSPE